MIQQQSGALPTLRGIDEKFCDSCSAIIKIRAEICPICGVRQRAQISKVALLLITFFFGGIGAHKFYTGKNWQGFFYLILFWTGIPGLIAFIEFIIYIFTSSETLQERYPECSSGGVIVAGIIGFFAIISIMGILAAIAIPQFVMYRDRAYQVVVKSELQNLLSAEHEYFAEHNKFTLRLKDLNYEPVTPDVIIEVIGADNNCFEATGEHVKTNKIIMIDCNGFDGQ